MKIKYGMGGQTPQYMGGGRMYEHGGKVISGQNTSTVRTEQAPDGSRREFVWYDANENESVMFDAPDGDWARSGAIKVYGNWNEYAAGQNEDGSMYLPDEQFPIMQNEDGSFSFDERMYEDSMGGQGATRAEDMMEMMMDAQRNREVGLEALGGVGKGMMRGAKAGAMAMPMGGQGASQVEDLLERLSDMPSTPMQFGDGGSMPKQLLEYFKNKKR
jgi:hypothetical protein